MIQLRQRSSADILHSRVFLRSFPLHLPYDIMSYLLKVCKLHLDERLVNDFWNHLTLVSDPWEADARSWREALQKPVWPLGLYGDEAVIGLVNSPFSKILGIYLNAVLYRPKSTRKSRFLMFSIEVDRIISIEETVYPVLAMITESCNRLTKEGIDGTHFLVSEIRGDQLFYKSIFRHQSWWKSNHVCFRCGASCAEGSLNYTNYDGWQGARRSTQQFIAEELPAVACSLVPTLGV